MDSLTITAVSADALTCAAAGADAGWLLARNAAREPSRRLAAGVLALLCAGVAVQAAGSIALFAAHRAGAADPFFEPRAWLATRTLLLAGTLALTALLLRRRR